MAPLLELKNVTKRFGGVQALSRGDFSLEKGEIHFLVGANGSGKSTLSKIMVCALEKDSGEIFYRGSPLDLSNPGAAGETGIAAVYQELSLVPNLNVQENMFLGLKDSHSKTRREACQSALDRFSGVVSENLRPETPVDRLSADEQQIVEIMKVVARNPEVIILDEATSCLHASQVEVLFQIIRTLKSEGRSIIVISHKMKELFEIGDRATIIRNGVTAAAVTLGESSHEEIIRHMVGERFFSPPKSRRKRFDEEILRVENMRSRSLHSVGFSLRKGEILGLSGLNGQGQSELLLTLFGTDPAIDGKVILKSRELRLRSPRHSIEDGFAYISGDRKKYGLFLIRSILENSALAYLGKSGRMIFRRRGLKRELLPTFERLKLLFDSFDDPVSQLSGGNQQKVVIGRWLKTNPDVILMDDPTKGVDITSKEEFYLLLQELCRTGVSIIWHSSEDQEILRNADRVLVLNGGRIIDELTEKRLNEYELYKAATA